MSLKGLFLYFYGTVLEIFISQNNCPLWFTTCTRYLLFIKVAFKGIHKNSNQISRFLFF